LKNSNNVSGYKDVCWHKQKKKYQALVTSNGKKHFLGLFDDKILAAIAVDDFILEHHGEYGRLNFPLYGA